MSITKGTIIRTIMVAIVVINLVLEKCGVDIINVDESSVGMFVETTIEIAAIAASWWYNNSLTENAKKADEFLESLNATAE